MALDENALICDLAETYGIYDYRLLPARKVAVLCAGLRDNSRIKMKKNNIPCSQSDLLLSIIADRLGLLLYGDENISIYKALMGIEEGNKKEVMAFRSAEEFKEAWEKGGKNG